MEGTTPASASELAVAGDAEHVKPVNGSWVAELEDAKAVLAEALRSGESVETLLETYLRICRAYSMLRQWERLYVASKRGLQKCATTTVTTTAASEGTLEGVTGSHVEASLRTFRKQARAELSVLSAMKCKGIAEEAESDEFGPGTRLTGLGFASDVDPTWPVVEYIALLRKNVIREGVSPDVQARISDFRNSNLLQDAALYGDVRFMEEMVALGAAIDCNFFVVNAATDHHFAENVTRLESALGTDFQGEDFRIVVPYDTTALLMACVMLAIADSSDPSWEYAKQRTTSKSATTLDGIVECAMQLVRLGADLNRRLNLQFESDPPFSDFLRIPALHGKSAFQIAAMSKRRPLVALMLEHMRLSPEERAEVVHCPCGSRLPWKQCHSFGAGQPPHYIVHSNRTYYRVSPCARCPCDNAPKTYYKCCWDDNSWPTYMDVSNGFQFAFRPSKHRLRWSTNLHNPDQFRFLECNKQKQDFIRRAIGKFRRSPVLFQKVWANAGPKSSMNTWDRLVYAGCLAQLEEPFFWKDVHWDLDRSELVRRAREWNQALHKYCAEMRLAGEERDSVVEKHTANPCGPCGYADCDAFEKEVREFQRCAQCKRIAYCGRKCQKKDWAEHQKVCKAFSLFELEPGVSWPHSMTMS